MLLKDRLMEHTKKELLEIAESFELQGCSGLRKAELADRVIEEFCDEEVLNGRLVCLTKEQLQLFRKACLTPQKVPVHELIYAMEMFMYMLGGFDEQTDKFCIYDEVKEGFHKINNENFKLEQVKKRLVDKMHKIFY